MSIKSFLVLASLFVASSLQANPLLWNFQGTVVSGTAGETQVPAGTPFIVHIALNTNLNGIPGGLDCPETVCFEGPFSGNITIPLPGGFTAPIDSATSMVGYLSNSNSKVINFIVLFGNPNEQFIEFGNGGISTTFHHPSPIPETPVPDNQTLEFIGPNVDIIGKVNTFSATGRVPDVDSSAPLLALALIALGFLRGASKRTRQTANSFTSI